MADTRLLISAYACEPGKGSEPGVGWHWVLELAKAGYDVTVLTRSNNRPAIEAAGNEHAKLRFVYLDLSEWARKWKKRGMGIHFYYSLWQLKASRVAIRLHAKHPFDAVHHLTFGVHRQATLMWRLGIPLIIGPVGGAEAAPMRLFRSAPFKDRLTEWLRLAANALVHCNPFFHVSLLRAERILCKTPQTLAAIPWHSRRKAAVLLEIGTLGHTDAPVRELPGRELRVLFAGRHLVWKGMALGLHAVAIANSRGTPVRLTMVGDGPARARWMRLCDSLNLQKSVTWIEWVTQEKLCHLYAEHDALLFPSLHDSSGNVVLEALTFGLPVVCLDLGGPPVVAGAAALVVSTQGASEDEVSSRMADSLIRLTDNSLYRTLSDAAIRRAKQMTWTKTVGAVWQRPDPQGGHE